MRSIKLNSKIYLAEDIRSVCQNYLSEYPPYLQDIFLFLNCWFDSGSEIEVHTSGSTGIPKLIRLSKATMRQSAIATNQFFKLQPGDHAALCLSANYIAGKMMIVRAIEGRLNLFANEPSSTPLSQEWKSIQLCAMVPMQVEETLRQQGKNAFNEIKSLIIGGAPVLPALENEIQNIPAACFATYGMTETASHVALRNMNGIEQSACYTGLPGIRFGVDDRNCLVVYAPRLVPEPIITNDVVTLISDTQFVWMGRYDFVINSGGIKLFPEIIEKKINHLISTRFYLTKQSDPVLGEAMVLVLEGNPLSPSEEHSLLIRIGQQVAKYEKPRYISYQPEFQFTSTGKLIRKI